MGRVHLTSSGSLGICSEDKAQFAFTWKGIQYTWIILLYYNRLLQGYKHSPTIAHNAFAKILAEIPVSHPDRGKKSGKCKRHKGKHSEDTT